MKTFPSFINFFFIILNLSYDIWILNHVKFFFGPFWCESNFFHIQSEKPRIKITLFSLNNFINYSKCKNSLISLVKLFFIKLIWKFCYNWSNNRMILAVLYRHYSFIRNIYKCIIMFNILRTPDPTDPIKISRKFTFWHIYSFCRAPLFKCF